MPEIQVYTQDIRLGDEIKIAGWNCEVYDIDRLTNESTIYDTYLFLRTIEPIDSPRLQLNLRYGIPMTVNRK